MATDFLTRFIDYLQNDTDFTGLFDNIEPEQIPIKVSGTKLTFRLEEGASHKRGTDEADLILKIWVSRDKYSQAWSKCKTLIQEVKDKIDFCGNQITSTYGVRKKSSSDPIVDVDNKRLYQGIVIFEVHKYGN